MDSFQVVVLHHQLKSSTLDLGFEGFQRPNSRFPHFFHVVSVREVDEHKKAKKKW